MLCSVTQAGRHQRHHTDLPQRRPYLAAARRPRRTYIYDTATAASRLVSTDRTPSPTGPPTHRPPASGVLKLRLHSAGTRGTRCKQHIRIAHSVPRRPTASARREFSHRYEQTICQFSLSA